MIKQVIIMETFIFNITFLCNNTSEINTITKQYRAFNYILARQGVEDYCKTNKTFKNIIKIKYCKSI